MAKYEEVKCKGMQSHWLREKLEVDTRIKKDLETNTKKIR